MRRISQLTASTALALGLYALTPTSAHAQASITVIVEPFGGRDAPVALHGTNGYPISGVECASDTTIPLQLTNVPYSPIESRFLSIWRGTQSSAACQTATNRRSTGTTAPPCTFVDSFPITSTTMEIELGAGTAFGSCDTATTQEFWILGVPAAEDNTTNVPTGEYTYGSVIVGLDPTPPAAPTSLTAGAGDRQIEISWTNPEGVESLQGANVYVDTAGCDDSGNVLSTSSLVAGAQPSGSAAHQASGLAVRSTTLDGESLGIGLGQYAAVAVALVDRAGNESVLSNVTCLQRVNVEGFWDAYCTELGLGLDACNERFGCAAAPGARGSWAALLSTALGVLMFGARRRAKRRAR